MPVALNDDQSALAQTVAGFAERHDARESTRKDTVKLKAGERPDHWLELISLGLHAVHLPEEVGGQGGSIADIAVVIGEAGRALLPGPLLPTVCASAVVSTAEHNAAAHRRPEASRRRSYRHRAWAGSSLTISEHDGRTRLDGESAATLGAASAELFVVAAHAAHASDDAPLWLVVERPAAGIDVAVEDGVDLGRDLAVVRFCDVDVTDAVRLSGIDADQAADIVVAMMAVEAAGIIAWCSDAATEFVKSRTQFGRPIGAFQAVQHRAAQLRITSELATAAAWDGVRGLADTARQRRHAVAGAAVTALGRAVHAAVECLALHGAIGFTWEHDVHLYWRRAIALAGLAGPVESWETRLGEAAVDGPRDFTVTLPDAEEDFRRWGGRDPRSGCGTVQPAPVADGGQRCGGHRPAPHSARRARAGRPVLAAPVGA